MSKKIVFIFMLIVLFGCGSTGITSLTISTISENSSDVSSSSGITESSTNTTQSTVQSTIQSTTTNQTTVITTTEQPSENAWFDLSGFAQGYISNRENLNATVVENEEQFLNALKDANTKVIEIRNDLNLGYYELQQQLDVSQYSFVKSHHAPLLHPTLLQSGVSKIYIQDRESLLIYSKNGNTIKHAGFILKRCEDVVIRNLKFSELWEFDEYSKGDYDRNDWDYFTIDDSSGIWLDHLEFSKAYDGLVDLKNGSHDVTISWSKFVFEPNAFLYAQFNYLEANKEEYPMYKFMRDGGMSIDEIVLLNSSQKKGHLVGSSELDESNSHLSLTLHHNVYKNLQDRLPRLRGGNVHLYNIMLDNEQLLQTKTTLTNKYPNIMGTGLYKVGLTNQGIVTTENGAVLMENSIFKGVASPIKNNQKNTDVLYTGKYKVINSMNDYNHHVFVGGSSDQNTPFVGKPATPIEFSWNNIIELPYTYQLVEMNDLEDFLNQEGYVGAIDTTINWLEIKEVGR